MEESLRQEKQLFVQTGREPVVFAHHRDVGLAAQFRLHLNNYYEIYVFVSGDAGYVVEDQYFDLERGDVVVINPYAVHKAVIKSTCLYERYYLLVPADAFTGYRTDPLRRFLEAPRAKLPLSGEDRRQILGVLEEISAAPDGPEEPERALKNGFAALELLCFLAERAARDRTGAPVNDRALPPAVRSALNFVSDHLTDLGSLREIAEAAGVSQPYLSAAFRRTVGVTLGDYVKTRRIGRAKILLDKGLDVTGACYECGFSDVSYFIRCFKESTGETPNRYRKRAAGK